MEYQRSATRLGVLSQHVLEGKIVVCEGTSKSLKIIN